MKVLKKQISIKLCILLTIIAISLFLIINFTSVGGLGLDKTIPNAQILDFQFGFSEMKAEQILSND